MMNDLIIKIEKSTRMVDLPKTTIGNDNENLQEKLIFKFTDSFVNGTGRLEYKIGNNKYYSLLTKENDSYIIPIQNVITKEGKIEMQLVITEGTNEHGIPVFKSKTFYLYCNKSINAVDEAPASYDLWIEQANAKLNAMDEALSEVDNLDIDANKVNHTATIEITKKDGTTKEVEILDGVDGIDGQDGVTPTIGNNGNWYLGETDTGKPSRGIQGETGASGQDGYTPQKGVDYFTSEDIASLNIPINLSDLTDDTTHRLVSDSEKTTWNSKSDFSGNYNDLANKPTKLSEFTDDLGSNPTHIHSQYLTEHQDISGKQDVIQYLVMPTANADNLGKIVQYVGATDIYTNGYFYICKFDEQNLTYRWENINVQNSESADNGIFFLEYNDDTTSTKQKLTKVINERVNKGLCIIVYHAKVNQTKNYGGVLLYNPLWLNSSLSSITFTYRGIIAYRDSNSQYSNVDLALIYDSSTNYWNIDYITYTLISSRALTIDNDTSYIPTGNYHPATKKYVDDIVGDINTVLSSLVTVGGGN